MPPPYARGHRRAPNKDHLQGLSHAQHARMLRSLRQDVPPSFDARTKGIIGPIKDQGQCGSCWDFSGTFVVETAFYLAGLLKPDGSQALSEQYTLSCGDNGGCNGDDNTTVLTWAKKTGLPLSSDYGPYNASGGSCSWKQGMVLYKLDDWGFANSSGDTGQTVTPVADIKAAIMAYGCVGCAVDAGFSDPGTGIISGGGSNIDHDVGLFGWQDTGTRVTAYLAANIARAMAAGWWWMRNSWGTGWGDGGCAKIEYGAYSIGTEAVWAVVRNPNPTPLDPNLWG